MYAAEKKELCQCIMSKLATMVYAFTLTGEYLWIYINEHSSTKIREPFTRTKNLELTLISKLPHTKISIMYEVFRIIQQLLPFTQIDYYTTCMCERYE